MKNDSLLTEIRRELFQASIDVLEHGLVERHQAVRLCLLSALAGEHTLLIGPPGTAKSELARRLHTVFCDASYFERLLTRFSVPEEIFGPLSIKALEEDRYERHTAGFLPNASIAFIDEVFKANSAILNALLTLLNEREFDNGAGRQQCPLISVIGATNDVPEDEIAEAFFDRFLVRLPVAPVSTSGFVALLQIEQGCGWKHPAQKVGLQKGDLAALSLEARKVIIPSEVLTTLAELRLHFNAEQLYVSDRRWVKIVWLLRIAAASEGRIMVSLWDLLLLPWVTAPDAERQKAVADWLTSRLSVHEAFSPIRLTRVIEAFEVQLDAEMKANELDYDDSGRLKFSSIDLAENIGDAKGGATALRLKYSSARRYGDTHIAARVSQIDGLIRRIAGYVDEITQHADNLETYRSQSLWLDEELMHRAAVVLNATKLFVGQLNNRAGSVRLGFLNLPRLPEDNGVQPEPVLHELLEEA